jgi:HSP20 family protein
MRELAEAERRFASLLHNGQSFKPLQENKRVNWTPAVDVSETKEAFVFTVELPGMKPEAVEIEVKENQLTIRGERLPVEAKEGVQIHHRERPSGRFVRVFRLPKTVDGASVSATYRDGLLEVTVPLHTAMKSRKIPIVSS